jgi:hypothetical protein
VEAFPFSNAEWDAVGEAALPVVNAGLADDDVLRTSHLVGLLDVLAQLRERHGEHPTLLETEADFITDNEERVALYQRAARLAAAHELQTLTIRLSLARLLLEMGLREAAHAELLSCESEAREGDESGQALWAELVAESRQRKGSADSEMGTA